MEPQAEMVIEWLSGEFPEEAYLEDKPTECELCDGTGLVFCQDRPWDRGHYRECPDCEGGPW